MIPTSEQQSIFTFTGTKLGSLIIEARAGCGKTHVLMELLKTLPQSSALLLAFNKRIADEMVKRLPPIPRNRVAHVKTLHAAGLWMLKTKYPRIQVDRNATEELINKAAGKGVSFPIKSAAIKLLQMAKDFQAEENPTRKAFDEIGSDSGIFDKISSSQVDPTIDIALRAYKMSMQMAERETIDFCDMGWLPLVLNIAPPSRYKAILLDEAQDVSPNQLTMVKRLLAPGGRIIAVGDRFQTIYGWRGAVGDAVWETLKAEHNAQELPLTMTFRCSQTVVALANKYVPDLRARPEAEVGAIFSLVEGEFMERMLRLTAEDETQPGSIFVLSRTNADLLRIALELWMRGVPFNLAQSADSLIPLRGILAKIRKNGGDKDKTAFRIQLATWYATELQRATSADSATWVERVEEQNKMLMYCLRYAEPRDIERLLESIYAFDDSCFITLSTVHKAKGLEAAHVYLLRETFQQFQNRVDRNGNPKKIDQSEDNTLYVGITRAQKTLTWVHLNPELQAAK